MIIAIFLALLISSAFIDEIETDAMGRAEELETGIEQGRAHVVIDNDPYPASGVSGSEVEESTSIWRYC